MKTGEGIAVCWRQLLWAWWFAICDCQFCRNVKEKLVAVDQKNTIRCNGCLHYFVTHDRHRPYGCARFGFKTQRLPSQVVIESTGMQCAYREDRAKLKAGFKAENQRKV